MQVAAGQPFQVEWVVGHGSDVFFVLIAAKDADKMLQHKDTLVRRVCGCVRPTTPVRGRPAPVRVRARPENALFF